MAGIAAATLAIGAVGGFAIGRATSGSGQPNPTGFGDFRQVPGGYGSPFGGDGGGGRGGFHRGDQRRGTNT